MISIADDCALRRATLAHYRLTIPVFNFHQIQEFLKRIFLDKSASLP